MRKLLLSAVIASGMTLSPVLAAGPAAPDPAKLRAILPAPTDSTWIEAPREAARYFDGPLTYESLRTYYTYYHQTEEFIDSQTSILRKNHFLAGYERMWYRVHTQDLLAESIEVFAAPADASSAMAMGNAEAAGQTGLYVTYFDTGLGSTAEGFLASSPGAHIANVFFTKGDALYVAGMFSDKTLAAGDVLPQARVLFDGAPATIALAPAAGQQSLLDRYRWALAAAGLGALLGTSAIVAALTIIVLAPRRRHAAPLMAPQAR